jgi:hypothetical protein
MQMAKYVITYDLIQKRDYAKLTTELRRLGACRVLLSVWLLKSDAEALAIANHLETFMDSDDRLVVIQRSGPIAWTETLTQAEVRCLQSGA